MKKPKEQITYEEDEDGNLVRVQTTRSDPRKKNDISREWNALLQQKRSLVEDLTVCQERIEALRPFRDSIEEEIERELQDAVEASKTTDTEIPPEIRSVLRARNKKERE